MADVRVVASLHTYIRLGVYHPYIKHSCIPTYSRAERASERASIQCSRSRAKAKAGIRAGHELRAAAITHTLNRYVCVYIQYLRMYASTVACLSLLLLLSLLSAVATPFNEFHDSLLLLLLLVASLQNVAFYRASPRRCLGK